MRRIFGPHAYSDAPRDGCWWDETCALPSLPPLEGEITCDVAVIGGGFTGLNAALHLAKAGRSVVVLEAKCIGWGASGRNGGFCCLGGGMLEDAELDAAYGREARLAFRRTEAEAVFYVRHFLDREGIDADCHSAGETMLAHRPADARGFEAQAAQIRENYGVEPVLLDASQLRQHGLGGPFHGAVSNPIGFGLNPRKYLAGLLGAVRAAGVRVFQHAAVTGLTSGWMLKVARGSVSANQVVVATNGYSSEDIPRWLAGRYMPTQSNVLVTRPLRPEELDAQGWTSDQMAYDSRNLLHYFRLMPDRRFLFGMRGGLFSTRQSERGARNATRRHFERIFPAWAHVDAPNAWSGMVAIARGRLPYAGPVPREDGLWAGLCYHGNGVAMGSYTGKLLAEAISGAGSVPVAIRQPLARFPLGFARRLLMPPLYAAMSIADR